MNGCELCDYTGYEEPGYIGTSDIYFPGGLCSCQNNPYEVDE